MVRWVLSLFSPLGRLMGSRISNRLHRRNNSSSSNSNYNSPNSSNSSNSSNSNHRNSCNSSNNLNRLIRLSWLQSFDPSRPASLRPMDHPSDLDEREMRNSAVRCHRRMVPPVPPTPHTESLPRHLPTTPKTVSTPVSSVLDPHHLVCECRTQRIGPSLPPTLSIMADHPRPTDLAPMSDLDHLMVRRS